MEDHLKFLARKGNITIGEYPGKTIIAIEALGGHCVAIEGRTKEKLLAELCWMFKDWPDIYTDTDTLEGV